MDWAKELAALPRGLKASLIAVLVLLGTLLLVNQPLQTGSAPQGIVSFQMAGTAEQAHAIVRSWRPEGVVWAQMSLWLDFLFIPAYVLALVQLTRHLMRDRPGVRERMVARWIRALFLAAGLSDATENILLLNNFNPPTDVISLSATICALVKFTGLTLGIAGLVIIRAARRHPLAHG
ncbi:hypothetical protein QQF73_14520 [Marinobacter sp. M216]|uniref:DUF2975 domain-containing protein n=1 Tax=Marinobacter albus TaxID=3030833 RepID=A0ABT7HH33_9GAMM|nr:MULTISPECIES: hypothetical protein [unclassified Marinobacter]MBW7472276.1 hypothetical protein [Marinobacter sp. F4218]MDK9558846.1 hypothetical protein [Marinobacter sp. M216]